MFSSQSAYNYWTCAYECLYPLNMATYYLLTWWSQHEPKLCLGCLMLIILSSQFDVPMCFLMLIHLMFRWQKKFEHAFMNIIFNTKLNKGRLQSKVSSSLNSLQCIFLCLRCLMLLFGCLQSNVLECLLFFTMFMHVGDAYK